MYYPALSALLDAIGAELSPPVRCVGQLANVLGVGSPDSGLYSADQFPRKSDLATKPVAGQTPARGVIEAKGTAAVAARHEVGLSEFLRRALLHEAPLIRPQDVAFFLASYARHALRLLDEQPDLPALKAVRTAPEEAFGVHFDAGKRKSGRTGRSRRFRLYQPRSP